jgi:hypothetical protein
MIANFICAPLVSQHDNMPVVAIEGLIMIKLHIISLADIHLSASRAHNRPNLLPVPQ